MKRLFQKSPARFGLVLAGAIALVVVGCSGLQNGSVVPGNSQGAARAAATLTARGPSVHLASGDGITILSPKLGSNARATLTLNPNGTVPAPDSWSIIPGTLHADFAPALHSGAGNEPGIRVTLGYPRERAADVRNGWAFRVNVDYANGQHIGWVAFGDADGARNRVSADLPASLLNGAVGLTVALGVDNVKFHMETPGPRYWDGKAWNKTGTIDKDKKTVVLIHGIFSSVEGSFPTAAPSSKKTPCPQQIANAGKFEQVLGFDYKWNEPPFTEGPLFADFLKQIADAGVTSVTIEAHSYGTLVTLAAIPTAPSALKVDNVVTLGGPLPLRGTPLSLPKNHWRMGMAMGFLDWYFGEGPDVVDRAFKSGMIASLATNSNDLRKILTGLNQMSGKPNFYEVAGNQWIFGEKVFERQLVEGSGVQLPWDGVVETLAAKSKDIHNATPQEFELSHVGLECSDKVIDWVGGKLNAQ